MPGKLGHMLFCLHGLGPALSREILSLERRGKLLAFAPAQRNITVCVSSSPCHRIKVTSWSCWEGAGRDPAQGAVPTLPLTA